MLLAIAVVAGGVIGYVLAYERAFDDGWIHGRLGGRRRPWESGQAWRGRDLSVDEIAGLDVMEIEV